MAQMAMCHSLKKSAIFTKINEKTVCFHVHGSDGRGRTYDQLISGKPI